MDTDTEGATFIFIPSYLTVRQDQGTQYRVMYGTICTSFFVDLTISNFRSLWTHRPHTGTTNYYETNHAPERLQTNYKKI